MDFILILTIGILAFVVAIFSIIAGFGGGVFLVPLLPVLFGLPVKTVIGAVLISLTVPALIGAFGAWRRKEIDFKLGILFEIPTMTGAYIGALVTTALPDYIIKITFGIVAILLSIQMIRKTMTERSGKTKKSSGSQSGILYLKPTVTLSTLGSTYTVSVPILIVAGLFIGFLSGMLGVGGGWLKSPLLIVAYGVPSVIATGTALFMIIFTSLTGGLTHYFEGSRNIELTIVLMISLGLGAIIGNYFKPKLRAWQISLVIALTLIFISIVLIMNGLGII